MVRIGLDLYSVSEISEFLICPLESKRNREEGFEKCSHLAEVNRLLIKYYKCTFTI